MAEEFAEPAREVTAHEIAVAAGFGPAGEQGHREQGSVTVRAAGGGDVEQVFHVQQAQIVLAAFADDDLLPQGRFVRVEAAEFLLDLALEVAGVGADPDGAVILFGPEAGGGDVAECLACAGSGFGEDDIGEPMLSRGSKAAVATEAKSA